MKLLPFPLLFLVTVLPQTLADHTADHSSSVLSLHGSGTTNPSKCFWAIMDQFMDRIKIPTRLTYRGVGSTAGQDELKGDGVNFTNPYNDFGSGDIPFSTNDFNTLTAAGVKIVQLPIMLGAISFFHSVPNITEELGNDLNLTSCLLAKIFKRNITVWDDSQIIEKNPSLQGKLPSGNYSINVAHRVSGSSSTYGITQYLYQTCPEEWPAELVGSNITWAEGTIPCDSSAKMTSCIQDVPGTIGYLESGHGHAENLQEIELQNFNGTYLTSKFAMSNNGIASAVVDFPFTADADFGVVDLLNNPGQFTWPIVAMTYIYVRQDIAFLVDPLKQTLLVAFLQALYDPIYINQCYDLGFVAVSGTIRAMGLAGINSLNSNRTLLNGDTWIFESETSPRIGQGDFVISQKRRTYAELQRSDLISDVKASAILIKELQAQILSLETILQMVGTSIPASTPSGTLAPSPSPTPSPSPSPTPAPTPASSPASALAANTDRLDEFLARVEGDLFTDDNAKQLRAALALSAISFTLWGVAIIGLIYKCLCVGRSSVEYSSGGGV